MKNYKPTFTQEDFNIILNLFNISIKTTGLIGDYDIKARMIINKIAISEIIKLDTIIEGETL